MYRRLLLGFAFIGALSVVTSAQPDGYREVSHRGLLASEKLGCFLASGPYEAKKLEAIAAEKPNCAYLRDLKVDRQKESLVYYHVGSDCHMRVKLKVFRVNAEKKYKVVINVIYGGCRAGGWRSGWIAFEKTPPGYNIDVHEVGADRYDVREKGADHFVFPKPPSVIKRETLAPPTVIDLKGCLPLSGQSRWVIRHEVHLENAIGHGDDAARCRDVFKTLAVDFSKHTLVGYSFASGHCERPPGLEFELVKETSSDPREDRFLLTARFTSPGENYCKTWTTYPLWMLVPKLPEGYSFDFDAKAK